jgi:chromosomal replication initiation ATPase DnaA
MCPQATRPDTPIEFRRPGGITGWQSDKNRLAALARAKEAVLEAKATIKAAETAFPEFNFMVADYPRADIWPKGFINRIKKIVCKEFDISIIDIDSERRLDVCVIPRHVAIYLCRTLTLKSYPEIGRRFGGRDHTTAINAVRKTQSRMMENSEFCHTVVDLQDRLECDLARWRNGGNSETPPCTA